MTRTTERKLERRLTGPPVGEPPPELRDRLTEDIPDEIELHPDLAEREVVRFPSRQWRLAAAATVLLALTAAVTWRLWDDGAAMRTTVESSRVEVTTDSVAPAPRQQMISDEGSAEEQGAGDRIEGGATTAAEREQQPVPEPGRASDARAAEEPPTADTDSAAAETPEAAIVGQLRDKDAGAASGEAKSQPAERRNEASEPKLLDALAGRGEEDAQRAAEPRRDQPVVDSVEAPAPEPPPASVPQERTRQASNGVAAGALKSEMHSVVADAPRPRPMAPPSTGGTHEPNDAPYGDVFFREYGVNPFVDTSDDALSTFGLEVDTGSYTVLRRYLADGHLPPREAVRVEEIVNFFDYGDPPPRSGDDVRLAAEGAPSPYTENDAYRVLRFGVRFRDVDTAARPPAVLTFVVDVSGSMARENRLGLVQRALASLLANLRADDRVGLVVYGSTGEVLLEPTTDHERVRRAIDRLAPGGSTNAEEGLVLGYRLADAFYRSGGINRVILCSDGVANVGRTGPESILERIRAEAERGIELTSVGFGMGNYNDVLLEQLADAGDGRYAYVDTFKEARRLFVEELTGTLLTVAHDAKVQVEFDPDVVTRWRLLGYENRDVADERFRDPTVDAGEIGAGHHATAVYEVKLADDAPRRGTVATLRLRYRPSGENREVEVEERLALADLARRWADAPASVRLAASVAELAELLKGTYWARSGSFETVARELERLANERDGDPRVAEVAALARTAARLAGGDRPVEAGE